MNRRWIPGATIKPAGSDKARGDRATERRVASAIIQYLMASGHPKVAQAVRAGGWRQYL